MRLKEKLEKWSEEIMGFTVGDWRFDDSEGAERLRDGFNDGSKYSSLIGI